MKKIIIIAIILIVVVIVVYRIATKGNKRNVQSISEIQKEKGVPVEVAEVTETELNRTIRFSGTVEGINQSQARADISERIVEFNVEIGDWVTQGQILGKLDPESPQVMVSQAKLAAEDAEREVQRMKSLFEQGAISRQTLEKVELSYNIAAANYKQVLEVVNITAPISGMVTDIFYRVGEIPPPGMPIARIADMSRIRVKMEVSPNFRPDLKPGQKALIYYPDAPQKKIIGTVEKVSYSADAENRNFQAYVTAENPNKYFSPGVSVEVEVVVSTLRKAIAVPRDALTNDLGKTVVYVVDDKAHRVVVETGLSTNGLVEITAGLKPGQKVVVHGQNNLSEGDPVLIVSDK